MLGHHLHAAPRAHDVGLAAFAFNHMTVSRNVVHHNYCAAAREFDGPFEVLRVVSLVRVDKD